MTLLTFWGPGSTVVATFLSKRLSQSDLVDPACSLQEFSSSSNLAAPRLQPRNPNALLS